MVFCLKSNCISNYIEKAIQGVSNYQLLRLEGFVLIHEIIKINKKILLQKWKSYCFYFYLLIDFGGNQRTS